jgi:membrane protein DedA with SNARE-associated domain
MLELASVGASLADTAAHFVRDAGLPAIFLLMLADSACVPFPSEATMMFAGFAVASQGQSLAHHHLTLVGVIIAGVLGNVVGSLIAYAVGYAGRYEIVERHGHWLHIKPSHIAWADRWFARYGTPAVFFSRMVPLVRTFISLPAGIARVPPVRFTLLTIAGVIPWVIAWALVGDAVGSNWGSVRKAFDYIDPIVVVLVVAGIVWLIARRLRRGPTAPPPGHPSAWSRVEEGGDGTRAVELEQPRHSQP